MSIGAERTAEIVRARQAGKPPDTLTAINFRYESRLRREKEKRERGVESERNALEAISRLPEVCSVIPTVPNSIDDQHTVDLNVDVRERLPVKVQVKSSEWGIADARRELQRLFGLSPEGLDRFLKDERYIFINGQLPPVEIQEDFLRQFRSLDEAVVYQSA